MDPHKLRSQVFEKTGIKVDVDDPIFALVALNEAVLAETVERHLARIDAASQALAQQARQAGGGAAVPAEVHDTEPVAAHRPGYTPTPAAGPIKPIATQSPLFAARELRLLGAAAIIAVLSAGLVLAGQALVSKPVELSPAQRAALARAEKLDKILPTLSPEQRTALETALRQP